MYLLRGRTKKRRCAGINHQAYQVLRSLILVVEQVTAIIFAGEAIS